MSAMPAEGLGTHGTPGVPRPDVEAAYRHCQLVTRRSGSSFSAAFWMLPRESRRALHAIYAFCRLADDIADDPNVRADRLALLARWRQELADAYAGTATHPVGVALGDGVRRFDLPQGEFAELLRGVETDLQGTRLERWEDVLRYCDRVASTVGRLIVRLLGVRSEQALAYATATGIAVQLTNILRDVASDAEQGRVYLAGEDLVAHGVAREDLCAQPLPDAVRALLTRYAARAHEQYARAESLLPPEHRRALRPAEAMAEIYRTLLGELEARGFPVAPLRLSRARRMAIAASVWLGWRP